MKTKLFEGFKKFTAWMMIIQMVFAFAPMPTAYAKHDIEPNPPSVDDKVIICHFTHGDNYNTQSISVNSADPTGGHGSHENDIIPAFYYDGVQYSGLNWPALRYIWLNNCNDDGASQFSVIYDGNGNTGGTTPFDGNLYASGDSVTVLPNSGSLVKTNYNFTGWNTLADGSGIHYNPGDIFSISSNTVLYAEWSADSYTVHFEAYGGIPAPPNQTIDYGDYVVEPTDPTKTGYTFGGWYEDAALTNPWLFGSETVTGDMTLYAKWTINDFDVYFDTNGGLPVITPQSVAYGDYVTEPADPSLSGYAFGGWYQDNITFLLPWDFGNNTMPAHDVYLYAKWNINQYTITFDTDGGNYIAPITQNYNTAVVAPANPTKTGYTFTGWDIPVPALMPAYDLTITAQWEINEYTVTFDSNGGSAVASQTVDYNALVLEPLDPIKVGYTFDSWCDITLTSVWNFLADTITGDTTLYAKWVTNQYTIDFDSAGGTPVASITQDYDTVVTAPADPTRTGYTFTGWTPVVPATMPAYDQTLTAGWNINQYTITFDTDGGNYIAPITQNYDTAVVAPANPTKTGYTFTGWDIPVPALMPAYDLTITAQWEINEYTVTFDSNGGTPTPDPQSVDFGNKVTEPADPAKTGYTFVCWAPVDDLAQANVTMVQQPDCWDFDSDVITDDMELIAVWQINQYTIDFDSAGGTPVASITQDYNTVVTAPADPTRTGYTFGGWDIPVPGTMPAYDQNLTAQWIINQYTIDFDSAGGTPVASITQDYDTAVTAPTDPNRTGYTFTGWTPVVPATMPAYDQTLTAGWEINQYTITFNSNGGSLVSPITKNFGEVVTAPEDPTRTGYVFTGWTPTVPSTMPAHDQTLVAGWSLIPVTPPIVLTPPVALAAPAAPAAPAPAVAGATDEPETVAQDEDVQGATDEPVQGSSDKTCPWWWIIGLLLIASLAFTGGVVKAEKDESRIRKYWYAWPPVLGGIAWVTHYYLHKGFSATWFCENYWLVVLVIALLAEVVYRFLVKKRSENR